MSQIEVVSDLAPIRVVWICPNCRSRHSDTTLDFFKAIIGEIHFVRIKDKVLTDENYDADEIVREIDAVLKTADGG